MKPEILTPEELSIFEFVKGAGAMGTPSAEEMSQTLDDLRKIQGSALLIGGMAVIHYGYVRSTQDVDILYANQDEAKLLARMKKDFKIVRKAESGWHHFEHRRTHVRVELIPEGGLTTYGFIPGPHSIGGENGFISLLGLIWLKLVSGRMKDNADIVELAVAHFAEISALRGGLPAELHERFDQLITQAKQQMENDPNRHDGPRPDRAQEAPAKYGKSTRKKSRRRPG